MRITFFMTKRSFKRVLGQTKVSFDLIVSNQALSVALLKPREPEAQLVTWQVSSGEYQGSIDYEYAPETHVSWRLEVPEAARTSEFSQVRVALVSVSGFDQESLCSFDRLSFYDVDGSSKRLLQNYCGNMNNSSPDDGHDSDNVCFDPAEAILSSNRTLVIVLDTDAKGTGRVRLDFSVVQMLGMPRYQNEQKNMSRTLRVPVDAPLDYDKTQYLVSSAWMQIALRFVYFDVQYSQACDVDSLTIVDYSGRKFGTFCGSEGATWTNSWPVSVFAANDGSRSRVFLSSGPTITMTFKGSSIGKGRGFAFEVSFRPMPERPTPRLMPIEEKTEYDIVLDIVPGMVPYAQSVQVLDASSDTEWIEIQYSRSNHYLTSEQVSADRPRKLLWADGFTLESIRSLFPSTSREPLDYWENSDGLYFPWAEFDDYRHIQLQGRAPPSAAGKTMRLQVVTQPGYQSPALTIDLQALNRPDDTSTLVCERNEVNGGDSQVCQLTAKKNGLPVSTSRTLFEPRILGRGSLSQIVSIDASNTYNTSFEYRLTSSNLGGIDNITIGTGFSVFTIVTAYAAPDWTSLISCDTNLPSPGQTLTCRLLPRLHGSTAYSRKTSVTLSTQASGTWTSPSSTPAPDASTSFEFTVTLPGVEGAYHISAPSWHSAVKTTLWVLSDVDQTSSFECRSPTAVFGRHIECVVTARMSGAEVLSGARPFKVTSELGDLNLVPDETGGYSSSLSYNFEAKQQGNFTITFSVNNQLVSSFNVSVIDGSDESTTMYGLFPFSVFGLMWLVFYVGGCDRFFCFYLFWLILSQDLWLW